MGCTDVQTWAILTRLKAQLECTKAGHRVSCASPASVRVVGTSRAYCKAVDSHAVHGKKAKINITTRISHTPNVPQPKPHTSWYLFPASFLFCYLVPTTCDPTWPSPRTCYVPFLRSTRRRRSQLTKRRTSISTRPVHMYWAVWSKRTENAPVSYVTTMRCRTFRTAKSFLPGRQMNNPAPGGAQHKDSTALSSP